jgi:hypothetical protein
VSAVVAGVLFVLISLQSVIQIDCAVSELRETNAGRGGRAGAKRCD